MGQKVRKGPTVQVDGRAEPTRSTPVREFVASHLDAILALVADGQSLMAACKSDPAFPTYNQLTVQIRKDPEIGARYSAVKALWKRNRSPTSKYFDEIVALIESGLSIAEACATNPDFPNHETFYSLSVRRPDRADRLAQAFQIRSRDHDGYRQFSEEEYASALRAIEECAGSSVAEVLVWPLPSQNTLLARCGRDPQFAKGYQAAMDARSNPRLHRDRGYDRALEVIAAADPRTPLETILKTAAERLPNMSNLFWRMRQDESFAYRANLLLAARKAKRRQIAAKPVYRENMHVSSLMMNDFHAIAEKAVSRYFEPADRDDIKSEMVLAMITGELAVEDAPVMGKEFTKRFLRAQRREKYFSLDDDAYGEDGSRMAFVDTFTADQWTAA